MAPKAGKLVVVANRLPVRQVGSGGARKWAISPGGLVTALAPILRDREGSWVGWPGEAKSRSEASLRPFKHEGIQNRPISLSQRDVDSVYLGFSNRTLWPLYHDAVRPPEYHRRWWWPYVDINRRFAEAASKNLAPGDQVWVHDYQLQLAPQMIRERQPDAQIGYFLHIPFPPEELFAQLPWRTQLLEGLLGADLIGFQTKLNAQNFARAAKKFTSARGSDSTLEYQGRRVRVQAFPISIHTGDVAAKALETETSALAASLRERLGAGRKIVLGVDRLDYTKGIDIRLRAFEEMLERKVCTTDEVVFVQVAVPSREAVDDYADIRDRVERVVGRINGEHGEVGRSAVHYLYRSLPFNELVAYYRAADVCMVTPYRDGMNLVAKEYVATRHDDTGVLVLSEFAGAAEELRSGAMLVNPHDIDGMAATLHAALTLPQSEARKRMRLMRRQVERHDVFAW
ncbi:MAG: trehalose-6-phosphate synthase, partial [Planctomycetota bacterium]